MELPPSFRGFAQLRSTKFLPTLSIFGKPGGDAFTATIYIIYIFISTVTPIIHAITTTTHHLDNWWKCKTSKKSLLWDFFYFTNHHHSAELILALRSKKVKLPCLTSKLGRCSFPSFGLWAGNGWITRNCTQVQCIAGLLLYYPTDFGTIFDSLMRDAFQHCYMNSNPELHN